jgi:cyclase
MVSTRVIPCLLLQDMGLVKTVNFKKPVYVGDPINAVKIFNEKEVDELIFLDITASKNKKEPNFSLIEELASECFMPFAYGGGINNIEQIRRILKIGVEKVIINKSAIESLQFVMEAVRVFGSSTIIVAMDVKKDFFGSYKVYDHTRQKVTNIDPVAYARKIEEAGAGELFLNNVDRDGTYKGFDVALVKKVVETISIPLIVCGGASTLDDFRNVVKVGGASAVSAGSFFIFQKPHRAVLISYPLQTDLEQLFNN